MRLKDPLTLLLLLQTILVVAFTQGNETLASCKTRYQYYYNGECYSICPSGSYSSSYTNSACLDCPRPCSECGYNYTSEAVECTSCANGLGMTKSGKCFDTYVCNLQTSYCSCYLLRSFNIFKSGYGSIFLD